LDASLFDRWVDEDAVPLGTALLVGLALKSLDELASAAR